MRRLILAACVITSLLSSNTLKSQDQNFALTSPDGQLELEIEVSDNVIFSLNRGSAILLEEVVISMDCGDIILGVNDKVIDHERESIDEIVKPVLAQKNKEVINKYNNLNIVFEGNYSIDFRLFDEGMAYRFVSAIDRDIEVEQEKMDITFPKGTSSYFPQEESTYSHYERTYLEKDVKDIKEGEFASLPCLFALPSGHKVLYTDADLFDYPNAFIKGTGSETMKVMFPKSVLESKPDPNNSDRSEIITKEADYIAKTILFLAQEATYITGQIISVCGGRSLHS